MRDLLFEIGTEEIPASFQKPAYQQLEKLFSDKASNLKIEYGNVQVVGTPRRLALLVNDVAEKQEDIRQEFLGPSKKAAYDSEGELTKAAQGFAKSKKVDTGDLKVVDTPKGEYLSIVVEEAGKNTLDLLPELLHSLILELSFPKSMKWGANHINFARPIQWLLALFGEEIVPFSHEGIVSSNLTWGHRFHQNKSFKINNSASYIEQLEEVDVVVDHDKRRSLVLSEIAEAVKQVPELEGAKVAIDENLVDTVTNLVETPLGVCGTFNEKFLQLPPEILITSMREHQKYFPVVNSNDELLPGFVAVNNTRVNDIDITRKGHQRVLRARLEDALFFYNADREKQLGSFIEKLDGIIFQAKLGTMLEKKDRLVKLVRILAGKIDSDLIEHCERGAELCKADLLTEIVGEFPSLQGVMGAAYASADGESKVVVSAIREHYMPKRSGAMLPESDVGAILGLADRFDTLVGCFGIGLKPTGTADPFGLRRITLAILHIIEEKKYDFSLSEIVSKALTLYGDRVDGSQKIATGIVDFVKDRFSNDCVRLGYSNEVVEAAVSVGFDDVNDCLERIKAISKVRKEEAFPVLAASYKRVRNIIKDNRDSKVLVDLLQEDAEKALYSKFVKVRQELEQLVEKKEYSAALGIMLQLKDVVDTFFDEVMVMTEDEKVRRNRINLLTALGELILKVGDISKLREK